MTSIATAKTTTFAEPTPHHARFTPLAGRWKGTTKTWFDPATPPQESPIELLAELVLGGRFLRLQYTSVVVMDGEKPHAGEMLLAYEKDDARYSLALIDSFHTGTALMVSVSEKSPSETTPINVLGSYAAGPDQRWGWRTVIHQPDHDANKLVIEAFNISPDGKEDAALKTELTRA